METLNTNTLLHLQPHLPPSLPRHDGGWNPEFAPIELYKFDTLHGKFLFMLVQLAVSLIDRWSSASDTMPSSHWKYFARLPIEHNDDEG